MNWGIFFQPFKHFGWTKLREFKHKTTFRVKKNKPYPGIWNNFWLASNKYIFTVLEGKSG